MDGLAKIPHIETLRLATRSLSQFSELSTKGDAFWVNTLRRKQLELEQEGKKLEVPPISCIPTRSPRKPRT